MAVRIWYEADIRNTLRATELAGKLLSSKHDRQDGEFLRGYFAALAILGASFGLNQVSDPRQEKDQYPNDIERLFLLSDSLLK